MDKKKKNHLTLIKSDDPKKVIDRCEQEIMEELENLDELEFQILTGAPDWTVAIDKCAPMEVKLRVLAAVRSFTEGGKSMDRFLKQYRELWEEKLSRDQE